MKKTDSNHKALQPGTSSSYTTVRINPEIYLALKMYFKKSKEHKHIIHSHEIMEEVCLSYLRIHAPELLILIAENDGRQR